MSGFKLHDDDPVDLQGHRHEGDGDQGLVAPKDEGQQTDVLAYGMSNLPRMMKLLINTLVVVKSQQVSSSAATCASFAQGR